MNVYCYSFMCSFCFKEKKVQKLQQSPDQNFLSQNS